MNALRAPLAGVAPRDVTLALLLALLTIGCWAALWAWSAGPYARYLEHPGWGDVSSFGAVCRSIVVPTALGSSASMACMCSGA